MTYYNAMIAPAARRRDGAPALPLEPLIAEFTATFGVGWGPVTRRKHRDDFARFLAWLEAEGVEPTTGALALTNLAAYVDALRHRPRVRGVWRGDPDARARSLAAGPAETLSANSVNAYVRPLRSLAIWAVDEGHLASNPFRRFRRRAALDPLLPSEETPTKGATLEDLRALEAGCAGERPLDLRDRAVVAVLVTTAARNSAVRLLRLGDVDPGRSVLRFRRGKGGRTLEVALHPDAGAAIGRWLADGRPALVGALDPADDPSGRSRPRSHRCSAPLRAAGGRPQPPGSRGRRSPPRRRPRRSSPFRAPRRRRGRGAARCECA